MNKNITTTLLVIALLFTVHSLSAQEHYGFINFEDGTTKNGKIEVPKSAGRNYINFNGEKVHKDDIESISVNINGTVFTMYAAETGMYSKKKLVQSNHKKKWLLKYSGMEEGELEAFLLADNYKVNKKGNLIAISQNDPFFGQYLKRKGDDVMIWVQSSVNPSFLKVSRKGKVMKNFISHYLNDCDQLVNHPNITESNLEEIVSIYNNCKK